MPTQPANRRSWALHAMAAGLAMVLSVLVLGNLCGYLYAVRLGMANHEIALRLANWSFWRPDLTSTVFFVALSGIYGYVLAEDPHKPTFRRVTQTVPIRSGGGSFGTL